MSILSIVILATVGTLVYGTVAGIQYHLSYKHFNWQEDGDIVAAVLWPVFLPPTFARIAANVYIPRWRERRRQARSLPPIHVEKGAKIDTFTEYKQLKQLVTDFEIENGFDRLLED
jgi:hypothetical protein